MPPPPSTNFKNPMQNCITQSVRIFVYKSVMKIVLIFAKCLAFCINVMELKVSYFFYKNYNFKDFMKNRVT